MLQSKRDSFIILYAPHLDSILPFLKDLFEHLRPSMERQTSFEGACEAVAAIEAEETAAAAAGVQSDDSTSEDGGSRPGFGSDDEGGAVLNLLCTIQYTCRCLC